MAAKNSIRRFTGTDRRVTEVIKWLACSLAGVPRQDVTHIYVVMSRPIPGDDNKVMAGGVPCTHMTGILQKAIENGEETPAVKGTPECGHKITS